MTDFLPFKHTGRLRCYWIDYLPSHLINSKKENQILLVLWYIICMEQLRTVTQDRTVFYQNKVHSFVPLYAKITELRWQNKLYITTSAIPPSYEQGLLPYSKFKAGEKDANVWQCGENYFQLAAMFDHMTTLFLHKPMVYGVVQQVYGLVVRTACKRLITQNKIWLPVAMHSN